MLRDRLQGKQNLRSGAISIGIDHLLGKKGGWNSIVLDATSHSTCISTSRRTRGTRCIIRIPRISNRKGEDESGLKFVDLMCFTYMFATPILDQLFFVMNF